MNAEKLLDLGWAILKKDGPGPDSGRVVTILTRIPHWDRMTWAERIFHRASYGFDEKGELLLKEKSIEDPETMKAILNGKLRGEETNTLYAEPGWAMPVPTRDSGRFSKDIPTGKRTSAERTLSHGWALTGPSSTPLSRGGGYQEWWNWSPPSTTSLERGVDSAPGRTALASNRDGLPPRRMSQRGRPRPRLAEGEAKQKGGRKMARIFVYDDREFEDPDRR